MRRMTLPLRLRLFTSSTPPAWPTPRGIDQDEDNVNLILTTACRTAFLHSIILVINGSHGRETATIKYVLTKLRGNVPDAVLPTVMIILTKCSAATSNFDLGLVKQLTGAAPTVFYMNNSFFTQQPGTVDAHREYGNDWRRSMKAMDELVTAISTRAQANTRAFKLMVETRGAIKAELASVLSEIHHLGALRQRIDAVQRQQREADENKDQYKDFLVKQTIEEWVQVDADHLNTLCMLHKQVCHDGCGLGELQEGSAEFRHCAAFNGPTCAKCPQEGSEACGYSHHYHGRKQWKQETKQVATELEEMKAKYFHCIDQAEQASTQLSQHEKDLALLRQVLTSKTVAIKELCTQLKQICKNANLASELYAVTATMQYDAEALEDMDAKMEAMERIDTFKALAAELSTGQPHASGRAMQHSSSSIQVAGSKRKAPGGPGGPSGAAHNNKRAGQARSTAADIVIIEDD